MISQTKSCRIRSESNPQNWRTKGTRFWELQKEQNSKAGTALDKILFRIWYLCWNLTYAGLDVSPAVRDYLSLNGLDICDWKFVDHPPAGPWCNYDSNNLALLRK
jgi:hypothetical protein